MSTSEDSGESIAEREENESVELRPEFEVKDSALHFIRAVRSYQQNTAAKRAAHATVVEVAFWFRRLRVSWAELFGHADYGNHGTIATNHP